MHDDHAPHGCFGILVGIVVMVLVGLGVTLFLAWVRP